MNQDKNKNNNKNKNKNNKSAKNVRVGRGTYRELEQIVKGFANHRRIQIMHLLNKSPDLSVVDISEKLDIGYVNASDHVRKLALGGLVYKRNEGSAVRHTLTHRGKKVLMFCKTL